MAVVAVGAGKGAPGVSTLALLLAALWPDRAVLAECDPAGSDVLWRAGTVRGAELSARRGVVSLGLAAQTGPVDVAAHVQPLAGGVPVLLGPASAAAGAGLGPSWRQVADALGGVDGGDVLADCGRLQPGPALAVAQSAAVVVLPVRVSLEGAAHLRSAVRLLDGLDGARELVAVPLLVGRRPAAADELRELVAQERLGVRVGPGWAWDPAGAAALHAGSGRAARSRLVRTARQVCAAVAGLLPARPAAGTGPAGPGPRPGDGADEGLTAVPAAAEVVRWTVVAHPELGPVGAADVSDVVTAGVPAAAPDARLVDGLRAQAAEWLAEQRAGQAAGGQADGWDVATARQAASAWVAGQVETVAVERLGSAAALGFELRAATVRAVLAALFGAGRLEPLLGDPDVTNIEIVGCDQVWLTRRDGRVEPGPPVADSDEQLVEQVRQLATFTGQAARPFDVSNPWVEMQLDDGSRLCAVQGLSGRPTVSIRCFRLEHVALADLHDRGGFSKQVWRFLSAAVAARMNVVVSGETHAGKTTLLRALANQIGPDERLITVEHFAELGLDRLELAHPQAVALTERVGNNEDGGRGRVAMADLVGMSLRLNPDRVIVGEVVGPEIVSMLRAMSQGNDGSLSTIHARDPRGAFDRITVYALEAEGRLPPALTGRLVAGALDFVVHQAKVRGPDGTVHRQVTSVHEVVGFDADQEQVLSAEVFGRRGGSGPAVALAGISPQRADRLAAAGYTAAAWAG